MESVLYLIIILIFTRFIPEFYSLLPHFMGEFCAKFTHFMGKFCAKLQNSVRLSKIETIKMKLFKLQWDNQKIATYIWNS